MTEDQNPMNTMSPEYRSDLSFLRHAVATTVYRGAKTLRDAPAGFAEFRIKPGSRTPVEIVAHICDLYDWALSMAQGHEVWHDSKPGQWDHEAARFYRSAAAFDACLSGSSVTACPVEKLFQGPVADVLTHVGQLAMLRHLYGLPIRGENYYKADIRAGQVGPDQPPPKKLFD